MTIPFFLFRSGVAELLQAVTEKGYTNLPRSGESHPVILQGLDVMGGARPAPARPTGFTLPLLQRLAAHANSSASPAAIRCGALILYATRELAAQVAESVRDYGKHLGCVRAWCSAESTSSLRSSCCAQA